MFAFPNLFKHEMELNFSLTRSSNYAPWIAAELEERHDGQRLKLTLHEHKK
jgi:hypothetical protein